MTNKTVYIHIGLEKTGTTSIQAVCGTNAEVLQDAGMLYPIEKGIPYSLRHTHWPVAACFLDENNGFVGPAGRDRERVIPPLLKKIRETDCKSVLISAEPFSSHYLDPEPIMRLRKAFEEWPTKILIYLRRQDEFFSATLSTRVKGGISIPFIEPFDGEIEPLHWRSKPRYDFHQLLSLWANVFGKENVIVRVFDRQKMFNKNIVDDVLTLVAPDINLAALSRGDDRNISLNINALLLLNVINASQIKMHPLERRTLTNVLEEYSRKYPTKKAAPFSNELRSVILDLYRSSNEQVRKEFFAENTDLPDALFSEEDIANNSKREADMGAVSISNSMPIIGMLKRRAPQLHTLMKASYNQPVHTVSVERYYAASICRHLFNQ